jgi:tetratricopeptide (TPR) repeat protein
MRRNSLFAAILTGAILSGSAFAGPASDDPTRSLTNWQSAMISFKNAGEMIGRDKFTQARSEFSSDATNLPAPYSGMASEFLGRLDSTLKISDPKTPGRLDALVQLCTELRACDAALRLQSREGKDADKDDVASAWRLLESGNTKAAMAEYKRKLAAESIEMWQDYWKEQIHLIEQRSTNAQNVPFTVELVRQHYLKGYETKADVFSALQELARVLPYAHNPHEAVVVHQLVIKNLDSLTDEAGRTAWEDKLLNDFKTDSEACAGVYLDRGMRAYDKKNFPEALSLLRKICADYPDSGAYGDAQFTIALVLQQQQQYEEAIAEYAKLFPSKVEDYVLPKDGTSQDYKCYRFRAALGISGCYSAKKDFVHALEYVEMARDRYKYLSWCKTCMAEMKANLDLRVAQLQEEIKKSN